MRILLNIVYGILLVAGIAMFYVEQRCAMQHRPPAIAVLTAR